MSRVHLQEMVDDIRFHGLPVNWNAFDIWYQNNGLDEELDTPLAEAI